MVATARLSWAPGAIVPMLGLGASVANAEFNSQRMKRGDRYVVDGYTIGISARRSFIPLTNLLSPADSSLATVIANRRFPMQTSI